MEHPRRDSSTPPERAYAAREMTAMSSSYGRVLRYPGALRFSATGLVARLPISMVGLGVVHPGRARDRLLRPGRRVSAVYLLANAVFAIPQGTWIDRFGQARVLPRGDHGVRRVAGAADVVGARRGGRPP